MYPVGFVDTAVDGGFTCACSFAPLMTTPALTSSTKLAGAVAACTTAVAVTTVVAIVTAVVDVDVEADNADNDVAANTAVVVSTSKDMVLAASTRMHITRNRVSSA
jgi:hypothetical protein